MKKQRHKPMKQEKHYYEYHYFRLLSKQGIAFVYTLILLFNYLHGGI